MLFGESLLEQLKKYGDRWVEGLEKELEQYFPKGEEENVHAYIWANAICCPYCNKLVPLLPNLWLDKQKRVAVRFTEKGIDCRELGDCCEDNLEEEKRNELPGETDEDDAEEEEKGIEPRDETEEAGKEDEEDIGIEPRNKPGDTADDDDRTGVHLLEIVEGDDVDFDPKNGTVRRGKGSCPYCGEVIDGSYIKQSAQDGRMKDHLYAVAIKTKGGLKFRLPTKADREAYCKACRYLEEHFVEFVQEGYIPEAEVPKGDKTAELWRYGFSHWYKRFNCRQLLAMAFAVREIKRIEPDIPEECREAVVTYLAFCISKMADYNSKGAIWDANRCNVAHAFGRHDFAFKWTYGEFDAARNLPRWALAQVMDAYKGISRLVEPTRAVMFPAFEEEPEDLIEVTQGDASDLDLDDGSVTAVVVDPPYYDNVQYAELADFFYVWLRLTLRSFHPDWFAEPLTEKDQEAVSNWIRFKKIDPKRAKEMARLDYERKMTKIFREAHRVLRAEGVMTVMFTHKRVEAWDTLSKSLIDAGFEVVSSWPIHTESQHSMHQANKAATASTILLTCRKRDEETNQAVLWDDIQDALKRKVRHKIAELRGQNPGPIPEGCCIKKECCKDTEDDNKTREADKPEEANHAE